MNQCFDIEYQANLQMLIRQIGLAFPKKMILRIKITSAYSEQLTILNKHLKTNYCLDTLPWERCHNENRI